MHQYNVPVLLHCNNHRLLSSIRIVCEYYDVFHIHQSKATPYTINCIHHIHLLLYMLIMILLRTKFMLSKILQVNLHYVLYCGLDLQLLKVSASERGRAGSPISRTKKYLPKYFRKGYIHNIGHLTPTAVIEKISKICLTIQ